MVGPVTVPELVDRPQMVTRVSDNEVAVNEFARWGESLKSNIPRVIASNLVKLTVFLLDMSNLSIYREARNRFFATVTPPAAPAVTLVEVSKLYGPDFLIEIEAVAAA